jgi:hypothetical protein
MVRKVLVITDHPDPSLSCFAAALAALMCVGLMPPDTRSDASTSARWTSR